MNDNGTTQSAPPDRLSSDEESPYFDPRWRGIRVWLDGTERPGDVVEYCVSEGWIRHHVMLPNGRVRQERGRAVCLKRRGLVFVGWRD